MYAFDYVRPKTLDEAVSLLAEEGATALAGGQTLLPTLKQRLAAPERLVDLSGLAALKGVRVEGGFVTIGAAETHAAVAADAEVARAIPALSELASKIGDPQVRNRGTLGGSVANNDPSACYPAATLALDGVVKTTAREIAADAFFTDLYSTALEPGEVVTAVRFRIPTAAAWMKFPQPASRFSLVGVFVARFPEGVRVAVTGASESGVFRATALEAALDRAFAPDALEVETVAAEGLIADIHGTPAYRAHLVKVMTKRAVAACA